MSDDGVELISDSCIVISQHGQEISWCDLKIDKLNDVGEGTVYEVIIFIGRDS